MVRRSAATEKVVRAASKRVVIAGYYGFGNSGDEMILQSVLADASSVIDGPRFTWFSERNR